MSQKPKFAVGSWAYILGPYSDHPIPLDDVIARVGALGFDGIELAGFGIHAHPDRYPTKKDRKSLSELLDKHGLEVPAYSAPLHAHPFLAGDADSMKRHEVMFDKSLEFCVDCKVGAIRVDTIAKTPFPADVNYREAWDRTVTVFQECADKARDVGMPVVWEFEPGLVFNKPTEIVRMIRQVGRPNFGALFDSSHAHMCASVGAKQTAPRETLAGGAVELSGLLKGEIKHVHLIDSDGTLHDNDTSTHAPFGEGVLDFKRIIPALIDAGYTSPWWSIDLCFWPEAWELTGESLRFVRNVFRDLGRMQQA